MVIRHGGLTAAERVKKAVEVCKQECSPYCPYWTEDECHKHMMEDYAEAIAERDERIAIMQESMETLEKRNEPVAPVREVGSYSQIFRCRNCDTLMVFQKQKYCHECGQAVKWND